MFIIKEHRDEHGRLHRPAELGPAIIWSNGSQEYWEHGKHHRPHELGPAYIGSNGTQFYYEHGKYHRPHELGPALIWSNGDQGYYENGKLSRPATLGPAIIMSNGDQVYYENGKRHRPAMLGPAVIELNGEETTSLYFENGIYKTLEEFQAIYKIQRWFRWQRFVNKHRDLFEKVIGLPANHESVLGRLYPNGGDLYKETYQNMQNLILLQPF